jgi:hypothetical protein
MDKNPAYGPNRIESNNPPQKCPLDPVPGIVKFIICVAKTNADITPITGIFFASLSNLTFFIEYVAATDEATYIVAATAGTISASAICIIQSPLIKFNNVLNYKGFI